jgi:hypothetical protein
MPPTLSKDVKFRPLLTRTYPLAAGQTRDALPVTEVYQSLNIRLSGTTKVIAGITAVPEDVLSLIRGITLEATSNNRRAAYGKFKQGDFAAMYNLQRFLRNVSGAVVPLTAAGGGPNAFSADLQLDFEFPHSSDPRRTYLNAAADLQTLTIIIDWGDEGDIDTAAPWLGVGDALTAQVVVSGRELVDSHIKGFKFGVNTLSYQEKPIAAASTDFQFDMRRGNLLRGILIKAYTQAPGATFHTPSDAVINAVKFSLNREVKVQYFDWPTLQGQNLIDYRMVAVPVGYAFIDFMEDGNYSKIIPTSAFTDVILSFDVAGVANSRIRVYPVEIYPSITS